MQRNQQPGTRGPGISRGVTLAVLVAALGYFVDIYDLILFSVVRVRSLQALGVAGDDVMKQGMAILDKQMIGMLLGGVLWGVLGDRRGRLSVLFGSILLYSVGNIANGFVDRLPALLGGGVSSVQLYGWIRFVSGIGLAGELGAGITLVSESMKKETRGYGTTVVASVGICGAIAAVLVAKVVDWRTAYLIGGGMGIGLLLLRIGVMESGMFTTAKKTTVSRGNFFKLFARWDRLRRYLCVILVGVPIWYVIGILVTLAPELGRAMGMNPLPTGPNAVLASYSGLALGDFGSGFLSQIFQSRKRILTAFILATAAGVALYFTIGRSSTTVLYLVIGFLGVATGYWAVFVTTASEQFGTNLRATVTTTAPNLVRGALVPINAAFLACKGPLGITGAAIAIGAATLVIALIAVTGLDESFGKDLDFVED